MDIRHKKDCVVVQLKKIMFLSKELQNFKNLTKDLNKIKSFTPLITTLLIVAFVTFFSLSIVVSPVLAAGNNSTTSKNQPGFFNKLTSFVKSPFATVVLAQGNQVKTVSNTPRQVQKGPGFLAQFWNFITAPYRVLFASNKNSS